MTAPKANKLWDLMYNGQNIKDCVGVLYPVLARKKRDLINSGTHRSNLFSVKFHK